MNGDEGGIFHMLSPEMRHSLLLVAREDAEKVRKYDVSALNEQRAEKERKEEL